MKIANLFVAAGLAVAALGVGSVAEARDWNDNGRYDRYDRQSRWDHDRHDRWDHDRRSRWDHDRGWDRRDRRWNRHHRVRCWTEWRYHHRVRICR